MPKSLTPSSGPPLASVSSFSWSLFLGPPNLIANTSPTLSAKNLNLLDEVGQTRVWGWILATKMFACSESWQMERTYNINVSRVNLRQAKKEKGWRRRPILAELPALIAGREGEEFFFTMCFLIAGREGERTNNIPAPGNFLPTS